MSRSGYDIGVPSTEQKPVNLLEHELKKLDAAKVSYQEIVKSITETIARLKDTKSHLEDEIKDERELLRRSLLGLKEQIASLSHQIIEKKAERDLVQRENEKEREDCKEEVKRVYLATKKAEEEIEFTTEQLNKRQREINEKSSELLAEKSKVNLLRQNINIDTEKTQVILKNAEKEQARVSTLVKELNVREDVVTKREESARQRSVELGKQADDIDRQKHEVTLLIEKLSSLETQKKEQENEKIRLQELAEDVRKADIALGEKEKTLEIKEKALMNRERWIKQNEHYLKEAQNGAN